MPIRQPLPLIVLAAVLSALVAGCASPWRFADRPVAPASFAAGQEPVGRTSFVSLGTEGIPNSPANPVPPEPAGTTAKGCPIDEQSAMQLSGTGSLGIKHLSPMQDLCTNDAHASRFDEGLSASTPLFPSERPSASSCLETQQPPRSLLGDVLADHASYYSCRNLSKLAIGVGVAACIANTPLDETIRRNYQEDIRGLHTDEFSEAIHTPEFLGNGMLTIPLFCGTALVGSYFDDRPLGHESSEWGQRCLRTILVGGPPMLAMQVVTGESRPGESNDGSTWRPFHDNNGVSGHSFMGAVPFISAAKMTDNPFWKTAFYAGSTLAAFSRINDDDHYASQAILGWWMAYVAASAVDDTEQGNLTVFPLPMADGIGMGVEYRR